MQKVKFAFTIYYNQPVGNMESVLENTYKYCYKPFLDVLEKHNDIKINMHYSGVLLEWLHARHPRFISRLNVLIQNGQVEILGGLFYEAVMPVISKMDSMGQIKKMNDYVYKLFDVVPTGMWLPEKIWEPHIIETIADCGIEYTCLDDTQILSSNLGATDLNGYFLTEEQGRILKIVSLDSKLRKFIPFVSPFETMVYIKSKVALSNENNSVNKLIVFSDIADKFGTWNDNYKDIYTNGYLDNFFNLIEESDFIETTTLNDYINSNEPICSTYLPASSYTEMMEWSLPAETEERFIKLSETLSYNFLLNEFKQFFKASNWRNFFLKYPESNNMHKKMLYVSSKVHQFNDSDALNLLWGGQSNLPYWHGQYGGIYLSNLRDEIYKKLIKAEYLIDFKTFKTRYWLTAEKYDFDKDSHREILVNSNILNLYISSQKGGTVYELDYKPISSNLLNTFTRKYEQYHKRVEEQLFYDKYKRLLLVDHFVEKYISVEDFMNSQFRELGDFVETRYESSILELTDKLVVKLFRIGTVNSKNIRLEKKISILRNNSAIEINYSIKNIDESSITLNFAPELNYNLLSGYCEDRYYLINGQKPDNFILSSIGDDNNVTDILLIDEWQKVQINILFNDSIRVLRAPIETISQTQSGFEKIYQGSSILPIWSFSLKPMETKNISFKQNILSFSTFE